MTKGELQTTVKHDDYQDKTRQPFGRQTLRDRDNFFLK